MCCAVCCVRENSKRGLVSSEISASISKRSPSSRKREGEMGENEDSVRLPAKNWQEGRSDDEFKGGGAAPEYLIIGKRTGVMKKCATARSRGEKIKEAGHPRIVSCESAIAITKEEADPGSMQGLEERKSSATRDLRAFQERCERIEGTWKKLFPEG